MLVYGTTGYCMCKNMKLIATKEKSIRGMSHYEWQALGISFRIVSFHLLDRQSPSFGYMCNMIVWRSDVDVGAEQMFNFTHYTILIDLYFPLYKERNHKKENISRNTIQRVLAHKQYSCIKHWTLNNNKNIQKKIIMRGTRACDPFQ